MPWTGHPWPSPVDRPSWAAGPSAASSACIRAWERCRKRWTGPGWPAGRWSSNCGSAVPTARTGQACGVDLNDEILKVLGHAPTVLFGVIPSVPAIASHALALKQALGRSQAPGRAVHGGPPGSGGPAGGWRRGGGIPGGGFSPDSSVHAGQDGARRPRRLGLGGYRRLGPDPSRISPGRLPGAGLGPMGRRRRS